MLSGSDSIDRASKGAFPKGEIFGSFLREMLYVFPAEIPPRWGLQGNKRRISRACPSTPFVSCPRTAERGPWRCPARDIVYGNGPNCFGRKDQGSPEYGFGRPKVSRRVRSSERIMKDRARVCPEGLGPGLRGNPLSTPWTVLADTTRPSGTSCRRERGNPVPMMGIRPKDQVFQQDPL